MDNEIFAYINLKLKEEGYTEFDMEGTNENLLYSIAAILSKMVMETDAPRKDTIKVFLEQLKEDINDIIDSNAWGDRPTKDNVVLFER